MADLIFRHTTPADIEYVAFNMREADREEVYAASLKTPMQALLDSVRISEEVVTAEAPDGTPIVIMGLVPRGLITDIGVPWLLGCNEALKYRREFVIYAPQVVKIMLERYRLLENYVHVKNVVSVRWLKRLGFRMDDPVTIHSGEKFMRFHMER